MSILILKKIFGVKSSYSSRLESVAKDIEIEDFFVKDVADIDRILNCDINRERINKRIKKEQARSIKWLIESIEK